MELLHINTVHVSMVLARPVVSNTGSIIFEAGEKLTEKHIATLKQRGIETVVVRSSSDIPPADTAVVRNGQTAATRSFKTPPEVQSLMAQASQPSCRASRPPSSCSDDLMQTVRESVAERFQFLDMSHAINKAIFELAVERQRRITLSRPGMIAPHGAAAPAFQTQRPPKPRINVLMDACHRMGTLPTLFRQLLAIIDSPDADANAIARVISADPALTTRLLRLVNSPFYGLASKVDTISRAVALVGTRQLVMLAMGAVLVTAFKGLPVSLVNMESFWSHSISCGASARLFAKQMNLPQPESFFVAGLLHDIARLLIYTQLSAHALYLLTEARRQQKLVHDLEEETLGFTHEQLGGELMRIWNCPKNLADRVLGHHLPFKEASSVEHAVLPAANVLAQAMGYGSSGEIHVCPLSSFAWEKLKATPETILTHCRKLDDDVRSLRAMFAPAVNQGL